MKSKEKHLFTSESVTEGHPDKLCDQISDALLDAHLAQDPLSRVACECLVTTGTLIVAGEITSRAQVDIPEVARQVIKEVGYTDARYGFDYKSCGILVEVQRQSPDIALGVNRGGAGDQGMMFGYATNQTEELMPLPIVLAHRLVRRLSEVRKKEILKYLRPDGKSQVTVEYDDGKPLRVSTLVLSAQHDGEIPLKTIERDLKKWVIQEVVPKQYLDSQTQIFINPTGRFEVGGPHGDTGLTGRKIIVDTYGGYGAHGGGAFSGKDPSKVDRSASYFARYLAKNVVSSGAAEQCEIQIAYAIGVAEPVSVMVNTFGTGSVPDAQITKVLRELFNFTPEGIIEKLKLRRPIFRATAAYGHFGRSEENFTWEALDSVPKIRKSLKLNSDKNHSPREIRFQEPLLSVNAK